MPFAATVARTPSQPADDAPHLLLVDDDRRIRDLLSRFLSGEGTVNERAVDVQINRLRRKIERDPANPLFLQAVRGIGYRLVASP